MKKMPLNDLSSIFSINNFLFLLDIAEVISFCFDIFICLFIFEAHAFLLAFSILIVLNDSSQQQSEFVTFVFEEVISVMN